MEEKTPVTYQIYDLINTYSKSRWFTWDDIAKELGLNDNIMRSVLSRLDRRGYLLSKKDAGISRQGRPTSIYRRLANIDIRRIKPRQPKAKVKKEFEPPRIFDDFSSGFYRFCYGGDADRIRNNLYTQR